MSVSPEYRIRIVASPADIDELGHVSNLVWLGYVLEAARGHSRDVGLDHAAYVAMGAVFVVRRHEIDYLGPAFVGDALLVTTWIEHWKAATSERQTRIHRESDNKELVRVKTTWAFVSTTTGRPTRIPAHVGASFSR